MDTIFTVKNEDLERLSPQEAVDLFRELLWAEARKIGIGINKVHISSRINVHDGGIDASVEESIGSEGSGIIKVGYTAYQIKTGKAFEPWQDAQIKKELFDNKSPCQENLGSSVKKCLDKDGTYILVCFKQDLTDDQRRNAVSLLKKYFEQCGYKNPKVELWSQNNLIGFLTIFPSLALQLNNREMLRFQTHKTWSQNAEMKREFKAGKEQTGFIGNIQNELRKNTEAVHIRVLGEPGIGKTRLVLEATKEKDLKSLVIYCDVAGNFRDSDLMNEIIKPDNQFCVTLVIDECDADSRSYIWDKLKYLGSRVKLISIYNEYDATSGNIIPFNVPLLDREQISLIIQEYGTPKDQADRWVEFCSGSPRVAHVFGQNLKNNPDDLLRTPDTVNVWKRYIVGADDARSQQVQQRRLVLQHIALFKRFGYGGLIIGEAQVIAKMIEQADPQITWPRFQEIMRELRERKILQGENTLYITPKALHIKLWSDWWENYGNGFDLDTFLHNLTPQLRDWFFEMFRYAKESKVASQITTKLLGENGPFLTKDYLQIEQGGLLFSALSEADPNAAIWCLQKTIGTWNRGKLLQFTIGRREVIWALERIAIWRDLFADAAKLLLLLAEAENETWANNASGVFAELFSCGHGKVAPSEASPQERFPILKEILDSDSKDRRLLALRACDVALHTSSIRTSGAEYQGLKKEPQLWMPKTYKELFDAYRQVWQLLYSRLDNLQEDEQQQAVDIILQNSRGLIIIDNLADMVIDTINELLKKPYVTKKKILTKIIEILHYDSNVLLPQIRGRLERLKDSVTGYDFPSLMKRYVGMNLFEDINFDEKGNLTAENRVQSQIEILAQQSIKDKNLLQSELKWLVTSEAENGYLFGYELGKRDKGYSLLPMLIEAQQNVVINGSIYFLSGYFRALFENDQQKWEEQLDALTGDKKSNIWIPELTWRSGMSEQAAIRILDIAKQGVINTGYFRMFSYSRVILKLSEHIFNKWIEFLFSSQDSCAASIALSLYYYYYLDKESKYTLPQEFTLKLLAHPLFFQKIEKGGCDHMDDYYWTKVGEAFVTLYAEDGLKLVDKMLEHFGEDGTILGGFHSQAQMILNKITQQYPHKVWEKVIKYIGSPEDSRAFYIKEWLQGGKFSREKEGIITLILPEDIWRWVDEDVGNRAWYLASFIPKILFRKEGKLCLAREVLVRYGQREDVRKNMMANFSSEGWSGPVSLHYQNKKQSLLDFKKEEDNENVKRWIDNYVSLLDKYIEEAKMNEERKIY